MNVQNPSPRFIRLEAAAAQVSMGKSTLLAWESTGRFPRAVRLSPTVRVWLQSDVDAWVLAQHAKNAVANAGSVA
ncbi:MAG: hypothetical protein JW384_02830 [Nitrosomonadaceae bacterium]|nr:hypothetical protein [Nitrosomonadaceae bacterium]